MTLLLMLGLSCAPVLPYGQDPMPMEGLEDDPSNFDAELKDMTYVGFSQRHGTARVFVKTTEPVQFFVEQGPGHKVVLVLKNTRVAALNNTRALDTRYFYGPVTQVQVTQQDAPEHAVRVEITVPHMQVPVARQKDTLLSLDFSM